MQRLNSRLNNRVAIVTGGAHGIGRVYAIRLAAEGAKVTITDLDLTAAANVATEITSGGGDAIGVHCDVSDEIDLQSAVGATIEAYGKIDILINNAAMFAAVPQSRVGFEDISRADWTRMINVNVTGTRLACKAVVPAMRRNGYGKIVNISSGVVSNGAPTGLHYVSSKSSIIEFTRTLAREVGVHNITVNCIAPGATLSAANPLPDQYEAGLNTANHRAINRSQEPEDLAGAMAFFASADSDFITGQTLVVDGGTVMN